MRTAAREVETMSALNLGLSASPAGHFKLYIIATVFHLVEQAAASFESTDALLEQFPFLSAYLEEVPVPDERGPSFWTDALSVLESSTETHLPLRSLRHAAGLEHRAITLLCAAGLVEEDARFGPLFDTLQDTTALHRPTLGLLNAFWREAVDAGEVRNWVRALRNLGLVQVQNPEAPRTEWILHVPALIWDAMRGETSASLAPWLAYRDSKSLQDKAGLIVSAELAVTLARVPDLIESGEARALVVRGPRHNGRHTVLGAVARALGHGVLETTGLSKADDERWRSLGPLATLLHAVPVIGLDLGPGETVEIPALGGYAGPIGIVLGKQGGVSGPGAEGALTLALPMPDPEARKKHWRIGLAGHVPADIDEIASRFRMTSGNVRRAAVLARAYASLRASGEVVIADVRDASRALHRQALDTLATRLDIEGSFDHLRVSDDALRDLKQLEARCRHREELRKLVGHALRGQINPGVRALFQGPSGTGKTLAAKLLAAELGMDLYRVELSSVVSKYIGETEKNLSQIFALAEELDIIVLLDEGDSMLSQRTAVNTSNDRYANLETNYLLQRIESFEGIVLITTNAPDLIDSAFQRRMDVVIDFRAPEAGERYEIWLLHLPTGHVVQSGMLREVSARCALSGGQIKNAVLHASLLALAEKVKVGDAHVEAALQREYRKLGGVYPLRRRVQRDADGREPA